MSAPDPPPDPLRRSFTIYPSIDLRGGRVVRLRQGDFDQEIRYDVEPVRVAADYAAAGATWLHVVDLDGAKAGRVSRADVISELIGGTSLRVQVGGGVRSRDDVLRLLDAGAARVVVGTKAVNDWPWLESLLDDPGLHDRLTLAVDAREGVVATAAWRESSGVAALDLVRRADALPLAAILYTDVARDGMLEGPDVARTADLAAATHHPVLASGGVGSIDHVRAVLATKAAGVVVGRSLYEGRMSLAEAVRLATAA